MNPRKLRASLIINGLVCVLTVGTVVCLCTVGTGTQVELPGIKTFQFFTTLSNVYCALTCLALLICEAKMLKEGKSDIPRPLFLLKQTGVTAVTVTLVGTLCIIAPRDGALWFENYLGGLFFLHFLDPVLAIFGFLFLEKGEKISWKESLFALIPVACYCALYFTSVVVLQVWNDFYHLTFGGKFWASVLAVVAVLGVTYVLSLLMSFLHKKRWARAR